MDARYPRPLAVLHWLLALMIIAALIAGTVLLGDTPNSDPGKIMGLRMHMSLGIAILILMVIRLALRLRGPLPPPSEAGGPMLHLAATVAHVSLYLLVFVMCGSGLALAMQAGLPGIVFGGQGALPPDFHAYAPRAVHGIVATLLMLVILGHVGGALYHHFVLKDGLIARLRVRR